MKNTVIVLCCFFTGLAFSQQSDVKGAFLEKWENSKNYLIAIAKAMPEEYYDYKPTEREMSFQEQLIHIEKNMNWLGNTYFSNKPDNIPEIDKTSFSKQKLIASLSVSFNYVKTLMDKTPEVDLKKNVDFFAGPKSKLQILNLLQDHVTHHRGQLIVYLNLKNIEPPKYVGW